MTTTGNHATDLQLTPKDISKLASADAVAAFLTSLGYDTGGRTGLTAEAIGLSGESAAPLNSIELLSEDPEGFLRILFVQLRSLTARSRNDLARVLGKTNVDHLLILTSDFSTLEFVLLDKRKRERRGPGGQTRVRVVPLAFAVQRKSPDTKELRTIRRFTWTCRDGLEQYDKLRTTFEAAAFTEEYFCNRALFADHFLVTRLREDRAWRDNPTEAFQQVKSLMHDARQRFATEGEQAVRDQLYEPVFDLLGFKHKALKGSKDSRTKPDYVLTPKSGKGKTVAFVYAWDRWLDGPDFNIDQETPEENPGACVVTALEEGVADWIIVTNGRQWRLYSRAAHSRATNFYEVDLVESLVASGDTDPNEAFRYWWLFYRAEGFAPPDGQETGCWLDTIAEGSRDYAKRLGERLKNRVFIDVFPYLARGFLEDRRRRLGTRRRPTDEELHDIYEATLTLLYRLLFLLYAEARDLLPIREAPYREASLKKIKEEIAEKGGIAESEVPARLAKAYTAKETALYDRMARLCAAMDLGDQSLNVPIYNGGLFITRPDDSPEREQRIARFLAEHKVPDRHLALAIDRLARDADEKTFSLVFIDYKSLEVRHLGSIYEGLLEFKLKVAEEDLTTKTEKKKEKYISLSKAKPKRGRQVETVVRQGEVFLSNDKAERKASGSYYTPDPIVEYIVEHTVGPVLAEKLEALRPRLRKVRKTFDNEVEKAEAYPVKKPSGEMWAPRDFAAEKTYENHRELVDALFDFRTLDPAMGSGHFLVQAVDFITDRMLTFLNQFPVNPVRFMLERTRHNILEALGEQGVAVDPDKLTEVNLLKRHVLKRCIYGVDLNPMAVELAKVSLWLDAFTIGAPLSFLNHHLRCGNSLIGATFEDLEKATEGQLFGIDYEPLLRAIRHVLQVNKMADATAAEVKHSASEYTAARRDLSGYQVVLDLLVAGHFGYPEAPGLLEQGKDLDLTSRSAFHHSLSDLTERTLVENVEEAAKQPRLRFFHWEIEFPEVFFGFADANERQLKHKNRISEGTAGFDAVVGNPPYVRQESLKELKAHLRSEYECFDSGADLFVYFFDRGSLLLSKCGFLGFITSGSWMKASFGESLRRCLSARVSLTSAIDFGEWQPFSGAEMVRPTVVILARGRRFSRARILRHLVQGAPPTDLSAAVTNSPTVKVSALSSSEWRLESEEIESLFDKLCSNSQPLGQVVGGDIFRGIITGLTEAFVISGRVHDQLCATDSTSEEVIRPYLEGKHLRSWYAQNADLWIIAIPKGYTVAHLGNVTESVAEAWFAESYPALYDWLIPFRARAKKRHDKGDYWWELRACDYYEALSKPKIVWPDISKLPRFSCNDGGHILGNTGYFVARSDAFLLGILASWATWFAIGRVCQPLRLRGGRWQYRLFSQFMAHIPIPTEISNGDKRQIGRCAMECAALSTNAFDGCDADDHVALEAKAAEAERELNDRVYRAFKLNAADLELLVRTVST